MPVPMLRLNFSYEVWISVLIVGRETAANLWFSVGSEVVGRVRGVRNPVYALHSDFVVVCQPLRCTSLSLTASLVSLYEAW